MPDALELQRHIQLNIEIPAHVVNAQVAARIIGIEFKILQPAQVVLVSHIKKIIS